MTQLIDPNDLIKTKGIPQRFNSMAPDEMKWAMEKQFILKHLENNEKLLECTQDSLLSAFYQGASMGLTFNPVQQFAYLIPYKYYPDKNDKRNFEMRAYCSPSYRGMAHLATAYGGIKFMRADIVFEGDVFTYYGATEKPLFQSNMTCKPTVNKAIWVFAVAVTQDGYYLCERMHKDDIANVRAKSKQPNSLMWTTFWTEGWKKTVLRRLFKTLPAMNDRLLATASNMNDYEGMVQKNEVVEDANDEFINLDQQDEITEALKGIKPESKTMDEFTAMFLSAMGAPAIEKIPVGLYESAIYKIQTYGGNRG